MYIQLIGTHTRHAISCKYTLCIPAPVWFFSVHTNPHNPLAFADQIQELRAAQGDLARRSECIFLQLVYVFTHRHAHICVHSYINFRTLTHKKIQKQMLLNTVVRYVCCYLPPEIYERQSYLREHMQRANDTKTRANRASRVSNQIWRVCGGSLLFRCVCSWRRRNVAQVARSAVYADFVAGYLNVCVHVYSAVNLYICMCACVFVCM